MRVSAHRYRQSRQGASLASSRWAKGWLALAIVGTNLCLAFLLLLLHPSH